MGRANDGRWYAIPFRIIPERGQRSENVSKPSTKQLCDVLQQNELWSKFANQTGDLRKETGTLTGKSEAASRDADVLAGEAARGDINVGNSIGSTSICKSAEHTSELQSLMRISYAVFCLNKKKTNKIHITS